MIIPLTGCEGCTAPDAPAIIAYALLLWPLWIPPLLWAVSIYAVWWLASRQRNSTGPR